jgi:hypothetical protein
MTITWNAIGRLQILCCKTLNSTENDYINVFTRSTFQMHTLQDVTETLVTDLAMMLLITEKTVI